MSIAISVKNVSKKFKLYHDKPTTFKEKLLFIKKNSWEEFWALKDINLEIKTGSTIGLIGQNGSGKSTLLKLMTKIIYPTTGEISINGRVSSLLELGAGFHPDFTGRENIYTNASIFGITRSEIDERIDRIIKFSELEEFIDTPVRTYSSGMYMRLAFSVAINVDPEILLIDEILAVGDTSFQKKCLDKISEFKQQGKTIVIVSHDNNNVKRLCDQAVWLKQGHLVVSGDSDYVVDQYLEYMYKNRESEVKSTNKLVNIAENKANDETNSSNTEESNVAQNGYIGERQKQRCITPARWGTKEIEITDIKLLNDSGKEEVSYQYGSSIEIKISYHVHSNIENPVFGFGMFLPDGTRCYGTNSLIDKCIISRVESGERGEITFHIDNLDIINGIYYINIAVHSQDGYIYDYLNRNYSINIYSSTTDIGIFKPQHKWIIGKTT